MSGNAYMNEWLRMTQGHDQPEGGDVTPAAVAAPEEEGAPIRVSVIAMSGDALPTFELPSTLHQYVRKVVRYVAEVTGHDPDAITLRTAKGDVLSPDQRLVAPEDNALVVLQLEVRDLVVAACFCTSAHDQIYVYHNDVMHPDEFTFTFRCCPNSVGKMMVLPNMEPKSYSGKHVGYSFRLGADGRFIFFLGRHHHASGNMQFVPCAAADGSMSNLVVYSTTVAEARKWYTLHGTWSESGLRIYVNGNLEGQVQGTPQWPDGVPPGISARIPLHFNKVCSDVNELNYSGSLTEVQLFDRALSPTEIAAHWSGEDLKPLCHWVFEKSGPGVEAVVDKMGNSGEGVKRGCVLAECIARCPE